MLQRKSIAAKPVGHYTIIKRAYMIYTIIRCYLNISKIIIVANLDTRGLLIR